MSGAPPPPRRKMSVRAESLVPTPLPRSNLLGALEEKRRLQLKSSSGTLYHILQDLASLQKQGSSALLQEIKILVVSHNIPTRLFLQWYVTMVTLPVTYLEDVTQSQSTEEVVTECLTLFLKLGTYLSKTFKVSSKGLGDNLHTLVPELLIPAETISFLCKAKEFMSPAEFLKMYNNPLQPAMASASETGK
ncbi:testis-expressed protein 47 isoform X2 [Emydura macquarii macquarii]|uniref:testis-expressed protein 47 isoform X2 n=1 Tax=Emydura macquarii macquarii TaxID=1129001 RepID=UPI003529FE75